MLEILIYYVVPNVAMFGGLYALAKYIENATWYFIENYDEVHKTLESYRI